MRRLLPPFLAFAAAACAPDLPVALAPGGILAARLDSLCIVRDGALASIPVAVTEDGRRLVDGVPVEVAHPAVSPPYAGTTRWFLEHEPILHAGRPYPTIGLPLVLPRADLERIGEWRGVPLFVQSGYAAPVPEALYLPVAPGCLFQNYQPYHPSVGPVREETDPVPRGPVPPGTGPGG